jgi:hypothetical protein
MHTICAIECYHCPLPKDDALTTRGSPGDQATGLECERDRADEEPAGMGSRAFLPKIFFYPEGPRWIHRKSGGWKEEPSKNTCCVTNDTRKMAVVMIWRCVSWRQTHEPAKPVSCDIHSRKLPRPLTVGLIYGTEKERHCSQGLTKRGKSA